MYHFLESDPVPETVAQLAQEVYNNDILQLLVLNIWRFEFEVIRQFWFDLCYNHKLISLYCRRQRKMYHKYSITF